MQSHWPTKILSQLRFGLRALKNSVVRLNVRATLKQLSPLSALYTFLHTNELFFPTPTVIKYNKRMTNNVALVKETSNQELHLCGMIHILRAGFVRMLKDPFLN